MKKYVNGLCSLVYSNIRFACIKIFNPTKFRYSLLSLVSPFTQIEIGKNSSLILGGKIKIKSGSKIHLRANAKLRIGGGTFLNHGCMLVSHENITLGDNVQLGPNVFIYDHDHDFKTEGGIKDMKYKTSSVEIGSNVWIGANTIILRGTKIGDNCVVGAGGIIKGEYPSNTVIVQKRETSAQIFREDI